MRFSVLLLRHRGRPVPAGELARREAVAGDMRVEQCWDETLRRHLRVARLHDTLRPRESADVPTLFDAALLAMSPQAFTLTGFERVDGIDFVQSWLVRTE
jgi:hypothetical protein